jgi:hypothetical protein
VPSGASAPCTSPSPPSRPNPRPTGFGALAPGQQQQQLEVEEEQLQGQQHGTRAGRAGRRSVARTPASSVPGSSLPRQGLFNNRRDIYGPGSWVAVGEPGERTGQRMRHGGCGSGRLPPASRILPGATRGGGWKHQLCSEPPKKITPFASHHHAVCGGHHRLVLCTSPSLRVGCAK